MTWIKATYFASAVYDGVLAVVFLFFLAPVFTAAGVELPNHAGYLQFPALLLLLFAAMYVQIGRDPAANHALMPYGMGLKAAYIIVAFWHWGAGTLPSLWIPLALIDVVFLVLFVLGCRTVHAATPA